MEMKTGFETFLKESRPTGNQISDMQSGHKTLRTRLNEYENLKPWIIGTFIQGSYRRFTAIRPKNDERSDVDVVVVTSIPQTYPPFDALKLFEPFMEKYYSGKWRRQGRSIGISSVM
jgi:tRNA nucleotidyltransferase (CCA-adding enzyme)